ncbi:hypothetical protein [Streptomyces colonosanans]|nr:hypothetical protein [Streptomyces colonosanans]
MTDARAATGPQTAGGASQAATAPEEKAAPLHCTGGEAIKEMQ